MAQPLKPVPNPVSATETKPEKPVAPKGNKSMLIVLGLAVFMMMNGGVVWYLTHSGDKKPKKSETTVSSQPRFIALEPFTVNLQRDTVDQFLQIGISLKFYSPELEEKLKTNLPEIRSKILLLLSSKHAAELGSLEGKTKLASEIIAVTDSVLGIRRPLRAAASATTADMPPENIGSENPEEEISAEELAAREILRRRSVGVQDVMFTSFIIQ